MRRFQRDRNRPPRKLTSQLERRTGGAGPMHSHDSISHLKIPASCRQETYQDTSQAAHHSKQMIQNCFSVVNASQIQRTSRPIQDSMVGDQLEIEQPFAMSQLTLGSQGSAIDTHYSGPPAHQNSSVSQQPDSSQGSFLSTSSRRRLVRDGNQTRFSIPTYGFANQSLSRGLGSISSYIPSLRPGVTSPSKMLLHMAKQPRRIIHEPITRQGNLGVYQSRSSSSTCDTGGGKMVIKAADLDSTSGKASTISQSQGDIHSTSGTQGSVVSFTNGKNQNREALRNRDLTISELKEKVIFLSEKIDQMDSSKIESAILSSVKECISKEVKNMSNNVKLSLEQQVVCKATLEAKIQAMKEIDEKIIQKASELESRVREKTRVAEAEFAKNVLHAKDTLGKQMEANKAAFSKAGKELLENEGRRQVERMKSVLITWMKECKELTVKSSTSLVNACEGLISTPMKFAGSLFAKSCVAKEGHDKENESAMPLHGRAISPNCVENLSRALGDKLENCPIPEKQQAKFWTQESTSISDPESGISETPSDIDFLHLLRHSRKRNSSIISTKQETKKPSTPMRRSARLEVKHAESAGRGGVSPRSEEQTTSRAVPEDNEHELGLSISDSNTSQKHPHIFETDEEFNKENSTLSSYKAKGRSFVTPPAKRMRKTVLQEEGRARAGMNVTRNKPAMLTAPLSTSKVFANPGVAPVGRCSNKQSPEAPRSVPLQQMEVIIKKGRGFPPPSPLSDNSIQRTTRRRVTKMRAYSKSPNCGSKERGMKSARRQQSTASRRVKRGKKKTYAKRRSFNNLSDDSMSFAFECRTSE